MARTTITAVATLLGRDYDGKKDLNGPIATANALVSRVVTCAQANGSALTSDEAELIERWMAAHFFTRTQRLYTSNSTKGSSASFILDRNTPEPYKATALELDHSGCLASALTSTKARLSWGGKTDTEKQSYDERN